MESSIWIVKIKSQVNHNRELFVELYKEDEPYCNLVYDIENKLWVSESVSLNNVFLQLDYLDVQNEVERILKEECIKSFPHKQKLIEIMDFHELATEKVYDITRKNYKYKSKYDKPMYDDNEILSEEFIRIHNKNHNRQKIFMQNHTQIGDLMASFIKTHDMEKMDKLIELSLKQIDLLDKIKGSFDNDYKISEEKIYE